MSCISTSGTSLGRLLLELEARITAAVEGTGAPRLALYSAHDSTVGPLLCALRCFDGVWPPFASTVIMELLAEISDPTVCGERLERAMLSE